LGRAARGRVATALLGRIVHRKFRAMVEGARLASMRLNAG